MLKRELHDFVNLGLSYYGDRDYGKCSHICRPYFTKSSFSSTVLLSGNDFR